MFASQLTFAKLLGIKSNLANGFGIQLLLAA